jgi:hypothetical protein
VNFVQTGLSAFLYAEVPNQNAALANDETYILMPHDDRCLRPVRMQCIRRLNLEEYRLSTYTALKTSVMMLEPAFREAANEIIGEELMAHVKSFIRQW